MNRCLNDLFGYCKGEPIPTTTPSQVTHFDYRGLPQIITLSLPCCSKVYPACRKHLTQTELGSCLAK